MGCGDKTFSAEDSDFYKNLMTVIDKLLIYQIYIFIVSFLANLLAFILYIFEYTDTMRLQDNVILTSEEREGLYTEEVERLEEGISKGLYDSEA